MATEANPQKLTINIPDAAIADLKSRLSKTRYPDQLENVTWEYGMDLDYLKVKEAMTCSTPHLNGI